jgi:hypothetical protein
LLTPGDRILLWLIDRAGRLLSLIPPPSLLASPF